VFDFEKLFARMLESVLSITERMLWKSKLSTLTRLDCRICARNRQTIAC
jgi:hypothetical protein